MYKEGETVKSKHGMTEMFIAALFIAAVICLMNPQIMDQVTELTKKSVLALLRTLDEISVDYLVMRGFPDWSKDNAETTRAQSSDNIPTTDKGTGDNNSTRSGASTDSE